LADRSTVAPNLVDKLDQLTVNQALIPDQTEGQRSRARLENVVRRVKDNSGRLQRIQHLIDAIGHRGGDDVDGTLAAPSSGYQNHRDEGTDKNTETQGEWHQPSGVHKE
jgi:hypothetical protein